jgi:hypothetical protein
MFYWFKRSHTWIRYEIRALPSGAFEFTFTNEAGEEIVETFHDEPALQARQEAFLRQLTKDGWTGPHGWVI